MTQSIEIKGTVLSEKFNEKFADLVMKPGNLKSVFCVTYKNESGVYLSDYMDLFKRSNVEIEKYFDFSDIVSNHFLFKFNVVDGSNSYLFVIDIFSDCEIYLCIKDNKDNDLDSYVLRFHEEAFYSFFSQTEEESTSEPEQPVEDAEEQENPELPEEENKYGVELTPLEEAVFEEIENCYERYNEYSELAKVAEYGAEYNGESAEEIVRYGHLANEQIFNSDYLKELISKAGLQETYQAWLAERKKQEALTVL